MSTAATAPAPTKRHFVIGTRNSKLAMVQAEAVLASLQKSFPDVEFSVHSMTTTGDNNLNKALHSFGAKSLWTKELEELMLEGKVDLIVHCLKDMPTQLPSGCKIGAILEREDPRDAVVMKAGSTYTSVSQLPAGSVIGTSSVRRSAQLVRAYPHLKFQDVRGNIGTRLAKLDDPENAYACLILAAAGLLRLDMGGRITQYLSSPDMLYAVGQGALAVETKVGDAEVEGLVAQLVHRSTQLKCLAERSLMRTLEGGCSVPIGVETEWVGGEQGEQTRMRMRACVVSVDGKNVARTEQEIVVGGEEAAEEFGRVVAAALVKEGAGEILGKINSTREAVDA
ncbi:porphobilinogen deaminase, dipyromethane cofactor binding domain-containing protein [Peziza echinospora]|nr:porphobilinogen deaminase, dipyromethane cofactor binding domain-containing protein [Peziza echinospora]